MIEENLKLDKDMKHFAAEIKIYFSKEELEEIATETCFVKRKGKIKAWEFVCLCCLQMRRLRIIHLLHYVQNLVRK